MFIADAQVHIWTANSPQRPWVGRHPHVEIPLDAARLLREMDAAGVQRAILVPPSWDDNRNDLVIDAARAHPDRFRAMGRIDTEIPGAREEIAGWCRDPSMLGLRCSFNRAPWASSLMEDRIDWLWQEAEKADIPIMLMITQGQVTLINRVAERHPGLRLAICHLALPTGKRDEEALRDFDLLLPIAKRPNVMIKASALPSYSSEKYPYCALHPYLKRAYDAFGPKRIFWGTDLSMLPCTYRQAIAMFTEEIPWLSQSDKEWIMGRGLCEWLRWPLPRT